MQALIFSALVSGFIGFSGGHLNGDVAMPFAGRQASAPLIVSRVAAQTAVAVDAKKKLGEGQFRDADRGHRGKGTATILEGADGKRVVELSNFKVTAGPDLEVWLSAHGDIKRASDVTKNAYVSLGRLKRSSGDQSYDIPADVDLSKFKSVVIWCEDYSVLFSPATLSN